MNNTNSEHLPETEKPKECPWCKGGRLSWDVIDDEIGQYVPHRLIFYCFKCGRKLQEDNK